MTDYCEETVTRALEAFGVERMTAPDGEINVIWFAHNESGRIGYLHRFSGGGLYTPTVLVVFCRDMGVAGLGSKALLDRCAEIEARLEGEGVGAGA